MLWPKWLSGSYGKLLWLARGRWLKPDGCGPNGNGTRMARHKRFHTSGGPRRRPRLGQGRGRRIYSIEVHRQFENLFGVISLVACFNFRSFSTQARFSAVFSVLALVGPIRLPPQHRHVEKHAAGLALQSTSLEMLHTHSRWRDLPRVWWVEKVADTMENRVHERRGGHRYQGRRREWLASHGGTSWAASNFKSYQYFLISISTKDSFKTLMAVELRKSWAILGEGFYGWVGDRQCAVMRMSRVELPQSSALEGENCPPSTSIIIYHHLFTEKSCCRGSEVSSIPGISSM